MLLQRGPGCPRNFKVEGKELQRVLFVPRRLVNIVVKES
jgi:hypothetical protein